jgi:hypothetical protein
MANHEQKYFIDRFSKIIFRLSLTFLFLAGLLSVPGTTGMSNGVVSAASNCTTSGPSSAYAVTVCITSPTGISQSGNVAVTATASVTGTNPGIQRMVYSLNGAYLLTDYQSPYTFTLPTARFVDGSYSISATTLMRDGFNSAPASITTNFNNGVTTPPVNNSTFAPALGSAPASGNPLVVVAAGDGASGEPNETVVTNLISSWSPNLLLYLGDVYEKGTPTEFYNWYGTNQNFGVFRAITDPAIGNHEYSADKSAAGYFDYWNNVPNYYSFNAGGWHFVSLNANSQFGQYSTNSGQYKWLAQDLATDTAACTLVYYHQPIYNIGAEPPQTAMQPIWSLLAQYKVDIVLNGHDHDYQRWVPLDGSGNPSANGITEFVVGSSGHGIQTFTTTDSRVAKAFDSNTKPAPYGALRLALFGTQANFNYINTAGTVLDTGTINCQNANSAPTPTPTMTMTATLTNTPTLTPTLLIPTDTPTASATPLPSNTPTSTNVPPLPTNTFTPAPTTVPIATATAGSIINLSPAADAYVTSGSPDSNFGTNTSLRADATPTTLSYMMFNVQGLSGAPTKAILKLYFTSTSTIGVNINRVADTTWGEKTITYNNAPAVNSASAGSSGPVSASGTWVNIDITSLIPGNGLVSMAITTTSSTNISMASRETGANAPVLTVQN